MKHHLCLILLPLLFLLQTAGATNQKGSAEIVVHLLDYLAQDYGLAVQGGRVVNEAEYSEQIEFANIVSKNARTVSTLKEDSEFQNGVITLVDLISQKSSHEKVSVLARRLQKQAIALSGITIAPSSWPDLVQGERLYKTNCSSCHGESGRGNGTAGRGLEPAPSNFHDPNLVINSSPFKYYNTIRFGVPGTAMTAFLNLSDQEVWNVAFYLKSLGQPDSPHEPKTFDPDLKTLATMTDRELMTLSGLPEHEARLAVASLRTVAKPNQNANPLEHSQRLMEESLAYARAKDLPQAVTLALQAYLEGIEILEPKINANVPGGAARIELLMSSYREALATQSEEAALQERYDAVKAELDRLKAELDGNEMLPGVAFAATFTIFLREGFEALLILIVLLSVLKGMGQEKSSKWVHLGWISAVLVGVAAWFSSGLLLSMSGMGREVMEGGISLFAVLVLFYVGFWLHRHAEISRWRSFLEAKIRSSASRRWALGLASIAFLAVFREAFEVVLFLRAIWMDVGAEGKTYASAGIFTAIALLGVLAWMTLMGSRRLPLSLLFRVCSWTMMALAVILAGKGVHALQEAGVISITSFVIKPRLDLIGVYPTWQTLLAQLMVLFLFAAFLAFERRLSRAKA